MSVHRHHRKRRSQGGDDSYGNLIELPPEVHELVHREPEKAYEHGLLVHSYANPADIRPDVNSFLADLGVELQQEKPKRKRLTGDELEKRKTVSFKLPEGCDGAYFEELLADAEEVEQAQDDTQYEQFRGGIAKGKLIVAVLERFTGRAGG